MPEDKNNPEEFDDVQISVAALNYYLYRSVGTPLGDNISGLNAWVRKNNQIFRDKFEEES